MNAKERFIDKIQKSISVDNYSEMNHIKDIVTMLREYVKVAPTEVKTMGEVMTPITLVEEMLDTLPDEVWTNPNLKWLDPCNGVGTFLSIVIERLMTSLESFEPDEKLRYKHIVENMIYACELQEKNVSLYLYAFDPKDEYNMNVYSGSYLDEGFDNQMKLWGVDKFDVIVMNPPYQLHKEGNKKSQPLWHMFVIKTISQLVEDGYLVAVHPSGWRDVKGRFKNIQILLKERQMLYLEVHGDKDGRKTFGAATTYDFYCLHNVPNTMLTKIKCMDGTTEIVDISKMEFIPNGMFKEFEKLIAKSNDEKVDILYINSAYESRKPHMSKEQTSEFKYPCIYYTYKDGSTQIRYSSTNKNGHFGIPKVIWSQGISTPIIDINGEYGVMNFACSIVDEPKNLPFIQKAMLHPDFIKLMSFSHGKSGQRYNKKAISLFRKDFWNDFLK